MNSRVPSVRDRELLGIGARRQHLHQLPLAASMTPMPSSCDRPAAASTRPRSDRRSAIRSAPRRRSCRRGWRECRAAASPPECVCTTARVADVDHADRRRRSRSRRRAAGLRRRHRGGGRPQGRRRRLGRLAREQAAERRPAVRSPPCQVDRRRRRSVVAVREEVGDVPVAGARHRHVAARAHLEQVGHVGGERRPAPPAGRRARRPAPPRRRTPRASSGKSGLYGSPSGVRNSVP